MSILTVPLPQSVREALDGNTHPGLLLDKYVPSWSEQIAPKNFSGEVQKNAVDEVVRLSRAAPEGWDFAALCTRRQHFVQSLESLGRHVIVASTTGPMTLHLARASALENAGICLHRIYGCVYLPGSGIKGMARSFAETVWLPTQSDQHRAWEQIEDVFGWSPGKERQERIKSNDQLARIIPSDRGKPIEITEYSGRITFHDALPTAWPRLHADILNNHHRAYYEGGSDDTKAPGDWEEPIPVMFLAVDPQTSFEFVVSRRRADVAEELLILASQWVIGALTHLGAGAKTAAGYGNFKIDSVDAGPNKKTSSHEDAIATRNAARGKNIAFKQFTVELVTPGFFGGAHPQHAQLSRSECDFRPATLRGQLRWWWRTMHAAWVSPSQLRQLEAAIWGNTQRGGAVCITIEHAEEKPPQLADFDRRKVAQDNGLPVPPNTKTTQGLTYVSYGMDETKGRRPFVVPGARWTITLTARASKFLADSTKPDTSVRLTDPQSVLNQAVAALTLLCTYGGVGSKSRKGFGSLSIVPTSAGESESSLSLKQCQGVASLFRDTCQIKPLSGKPHDPESPSLEQMETVASIPTPWANYWYALDRYGDSCQQFAQSYKHNNEKLALGLPRRIKNPFGVFKTGHRAADSDRHASPIMAHLRRDANGNYAVRLIAFPSVELPADQTAEKSRQFLRKAIQQIKANLEQQCQTHGNEGRSAAKTTLGTSSQPAAASLTAPPIKPGDWVKAILLPEKTSKGGWKAQHPGTKLSGPIQNSAEVPGDNVAGNELELVIALVNTREIAFRYPTKTDVERKNKPSKPPPQTPPRRR